jgi:hypothetical protein
MATKTTKAATARPTISEFSGWIGAAVRKLYHLEDGADLAFNLLEAGELTVDMSVETAAQIVAQHLEQQ